LEGKEKKGIFSVLEFKGKKKIFFLHLNDRKKMSVNGNLGIKRLLALRRNPATTGFVRFNETEELTGVGEIKSVKRNKGDHSAIHGNVSAALSTLLLNQETHLASLTSCARLGPYAYMHTPKAFDDIFDIRVSDPVQRHIDALSPEFFISARFSMNNNIAITAVASNSGEQDMSVVPIDLANNNKKQSKKKKITTVIDKTINSKSKIVKPRRELNEIVQSISKMHQINNQAFIKLAKVLNRKNSSFFKE
jgi:hypothetical protein